MKQSTTTLSTGMLLLGVALVMMACNDRSNVSGPRQPDFGTAQFAIIDFSDVENGIEDATTESEMTFNTALLDYAVIGGDQPFGPGQNNLRGMRWYDRFDFGKHLGRIFRQLNLTDDQRTTVRERVRTFHTTMKPLVRRFHEANKSIIQDANAKRKLIMEEVRAGTLTREEARARIEGLNEATRELIKANPDSQSIKTAMCGARDRLFAGVRALLDEEQIAKWDNWITRLKDPCIP